MRANNKIFYSADFKKYYKGEENFTIPDEFTEIWINVFRGCHSLKKVIIPSSVNIIGVSAFFRCTNLEEIELPVNLESIYDEAFRECHSLKKVNVPTNVRRIGDRAFYNCDQLKEIQLPENLIKIGEEAFSGCSSLSKIIIPDNVSIIEDSAFDICNALKEVVLPKKIDEFGYKVFRYCSLESVTLHANYGKFGCEIIEKIRDRDRVENFELIIKYDNYKELYKFMKFIKNSITYDLLFHKNYNLTIVFDGEKLSFFEQIILNRLFSNNNIKISFNDKENNMKQDKLSIEENNQSLNLSDEIKELINEINTLSSKLSEEIKNMINQKIENLLDDYRKGMAEKNKRPTLNLEKETINLKIEPLDPETTLLLSLKKIKLDFSRHDQLLKDLSSIYKCKNLINTKVEQKPSELNNLEEIIKTIIYLTSKIDDKKSKEFINNIKKILLDAETKYNKDLDNLFNNDKNPLVFEEGLTNQQLKITLLNILDNLTEYSKKVIPYLELLEVLKQKEVTSYKKGDSIKDTIIGAKYILSLITNEKNKKILEEDIKSFCDEYIKKIEDILTDTNVIEKDDYQKLEIEISKKIHPILEKLNLYSKKDVNEKDILTQLSNSITILNSTKTAEINNKKAIENFIGELHNKIINNNQVLDNEKQEIKQRLLNIINKWIEHIDKMDNNENMIEVMNVILKDIAEVDIEVTIFMKNLSNYNNKKL